MLAQAALASYRRRRFAWLFATLLATIVARPALKAAAPGVNALDLLMIVSLVAAIASVAHERSIRILLLLGVVFVAFHAIQAVMGVPVLLSVSQLLWIVIGGVAAWAAAHHAFRARVVDAEHLFAALDAYLLVGLAFGVGYWLLEQAWPASFGTAMPGELDLARAIYFSFVTIATLGYGDIVPANDTTRGLVILEAVAGQMYLAVLVARLVSLYSRDQDRDKRLPD